MAFKSQNKQSTTSVLLFISVFFITLQSFYFPLVGSFLTFIGYFILLGLTISKGKAQIDGKWLFGMITLVLLAYGVVLVIKIPDVADIRTYLATLFIVTSLPLVASFADRNPLLFDQAIKLVILLHVLFLFTQVLYFAVTLQYLDFLDILNVTESGSLGAKSLIVAGVRVPRFSGLFNEPGTYSVIIMSLLACYYSLTEKLTPLIISASITVMFTLSLFGVVLLLLFYLSVVLTANRKNLLRLIGVIAFIACVAYYSGITSAIVDRFTLSSDDSGLGFRQSMLQDFFANEVWMLTGILNRELPDYFVINDLGVWFAFILTFGIFGLIILIFLIGACAVKGRSVIVIGLFMTVLLTKLKLTYPIFWVIFILICYANKRGTVEYSHKA